MSRMNRKRIFSKPSQSMLSNRYQFRVAWGGIPHPEKAWKGGQDALFAGSNILVVADGVSGWSKMGIDSGIYSRKLIANIKHLIEGQHMLYYIEHPDELALKAVQLTEEKGSSTLTILTLQPQTGILRSFHIGDSIYGIFKRNGQLIMAEQQQRQFDMPFQVYGGKMNSRDSNKRQGAGPSDVYYGEYNQFSYHQIGSNPILVASDGLWDNIHVKEIHDTLMESTDLRQKTKYLLQKTMHYCSLNSYISPYYHKALSKGVRAQQVGKLDDVSIILAEIVCLQE